MRLTIELWCRRLTVEWADQHDDPPEGRSEVRSDGDVYADVERRPSDSHETPPIGFQRRDPA